MITQFDNESVGRIRSAVKWVEAQGGSSVDLNRRTRHRQSMSEPLVLAKITAWTSGSDIVTADLYGNGIALPITTSGVSVKIAHNPDTKPPNNKCVIFVKEVHGQSGYSYEGAWVPVSNNSIAYFNEMRVADSGTDWQIENDFRSLYINYSSDGQIQPYDSGATTTTIPLRFDCTSEIDLAPENRVSGGYLQTRCKKVMLAVSGTTPPKLYLKASSNYGAWANGAIVSGCA